MNSFILDTEWLIGRHRRGCWYLSTRTDGGDKDPNRMERKSHDGHQRSLDDLMAQGDKVTSPDGACVVFVIKLFSVREYSGIQVLVPGCDGHSPAQIM